MASLNRVTLIGNLGHDPELRYTLGKTPVATLNVATTQAYTDKEGQPHEQTEWHRVIVWSKQAENCARYLSKGRQVFVDGRLHTRSYEDKNGNERTLTEIVAQNVLFLGSPHGVRHDAGKPSEEHEESREQEPSARPIAPAVSAATRIKARKNGKKDKDTKPETKDKSGEDRNAITPMASPWDPPRYEEIPF